MINAQVAVLVQKVVDFAEYIYDFTEMPATR